LDILAFTASADAESTIAFLASGFQGVIAKPMTPASVISAVARSVGLMFEPEAVADVG